MTEEGADFVAEDERSVWAVEYSDLILGGHENYIIDDRLYPSVEMANTVRATKVENGSNPEMLYIEEYQLVADIDTDDPSQEDPDG